MSEHVIQSGLKRKQDSKALEVAMEVMTNPAISLLDQLKIEAQVLVPVLEALRAELGRERADELVTTAVRDWRREVIVRAGALVPGSSKERFEAFMASSFQRIGEDVDTEVLKQESEALEIDIVGCRYADLFHALGEPGLGAAMACECDDHMADVVGPELEYTRTQTIMKGASCCDFRYRLTSDEDSKPDVDR